MAQNGGRINAGVQKEPEIISAQKITPADGLQPPLT